MRRRRFIKEATLFAIAVSTTGFISCGRKKDDPNPVFTGDCPTTSDILGPFYKPGAPITDDLTFAGQQGEVIFIKGKVLKPDCTTAFSDAMVEIWHADMDGEYDTGNTFRMRGRYKTEADGSYSFKTILPGRYKNGATYRPSHYHFRVTAPEHKELVSQIYLQNDPYISSDPWASKPEAQQRILDIKENSEGEKVIEFNIGMVRA